MADQILVLHHEDTWFYFLPSSYNTVTWFAEAGDTVEELVPTKKARWYTGTFLAERLKQRRPGGKKTVGYTLKDETAASERFPLVLTVAEWDERTDDDDDNDTPEHSLYARITEPQPDQDTVFEGPWLVTDGSPAPQDGRSWSARLPYELQHHSELLHLYPGTMGGFREALVLRLNQIPMVTAYNQAEFSVYAKVRYEPPTFTWTGKGRAKRQVESRLMRHETWSPPREVPGVNRAAAAVRWDQLMTQYLQAATDMATVRPCSACHETGIAPYKEETK